MIGLINYIPKGDITNPDISEGNNIIVHCCNDIPTIGAGVAKALYMKWPQVKEQYMLWKEITDLGYHAEEELGIDNHAEKYQYHFPNPGIRAFGLGNAQIVAVDNAMVCNMIGQHDIKAKGNCPPVRYVAFDSVFSMLSQMARESEVETTIHVPYLMGCDLAGGTWDLVEALLMKHFIDNDIPVKCYDLFEKRK